ncbi:MAG: type II toxin-antitoxin system RelE/ParE family toxin [Gammaproteobacteria bacterium]|jgi:mRNA-degrading endonuclease RelE of RelBE toxin-antitoxin system|nr:type II toxin-antitoxin system RelE/ParE family toxin [Gammaproteobacteria bacterium]
MKVVQTGSFRRKAKKLHATEKTALDRAVRKLVASPESGASKKGDLAGVRVLKYKVKAQQYLLAYSYEPELITLLAIGTHENFYRDIGKQ